jgi:hypothetical protein
MDFYSTGETENEQDAAAWTKAENVRASRKDDDSLLPSVIRLPLPVSMRTTQPGPHGPDEVVSEHRLHPPSELHHLLRYRNQLQWTTFTPASTMIPTCRQGLAQQPPANRMRRAGHTREVASGARRNTPAVNISRSPRQRNAGTQRREVWSTSRLK